MFMCSIAMWAGLHPSGGVFHGEQLHTIQSVETSCLYLPTALISGEDSTCYFMLYFTQHMGAHHKYLGFSIETPVENKAFGQRSRGGF